MIRTYSTKEVALALGVCEESVRRWCRSGKLKHDISSRKEGCIITEFDLYGFAENNPKYGKDIMRLVGDTTDDIFDRLDSVIEDLETTIENVELMLSCYKSIRERMKS